MGRKLCKANCVRAHQLSYTLHICAYVCYNKQGNKDRAITFLTVIQKKRVWNVDWNITYSDLFTAGFPHSLQSDTETVPHLGHYLSLPLPF